jgi:pyruvate/2-oxoacid:ferredoxin oxidoreductase alpha subunit
MYPYDFENAYFLIQKALIWGDIYQHPIVFLLDKQFSESYKNIEMDKLKKVEEPENLNFIKFNQNFKEKF